MKHFFISAELGEGIPDYNFVVKAETRYEAEEIAFKILTDDYGDSDTPHKNYTCEVITAQTLLEKLTLN